MVAPGAEIERNQANLQPPPPSPDDSALADKPIWERILERTADIPEEEWDKLPTDLAEQHDHYLSRHAEASAGMRQIFVDALDWIAITNRRDQWHQPAVDASRGLVKCRLVTTDEVLTEVLNAFGEAGPFFRRETMAPVRDLPGDPLAAVIPQSRQTFLAGIALYEARLDKGYSLTDCISMATMRREGISEVLTNDDHFAQEGFLKLL